MPHVPDPPTPAWEKALTEATKKLGISIGKSQGMFIITKNLAWEAIPASNMWTAIRIHTNLWIATAANLNEAQRKGQPGKDFLNQNGQIQLLDVLLTSKATEIIANPTEAINLIITEACLSQTPTFADILIEATKTNPECLAECHNAVKAYEFANLATRHPDTRWIKPLLKLRHIGYSVEPETLATAL